VVGSSRPELHRYLHEIKVTRRLATIRIDQSYESLQPTCSCSVVCQSSYFVRTKSWRLCRPFSAQPDAVYAPDTTIEAVFVEKVAATRTTERGAATQQIEFCTFLLMGSRLPCNRQFGRLRDELSPCSFGFHTTHAGFGTLLRRRESGRVTDRVWSSLAST
jgi:hypothetical protein